MRPPEKKTTTESIELYKQSLEGNNYSLQSIKAYLGDIGQFVEWLKTRRVDFDIPYRIARIDIVEFINHLASRKTTAVTRKRKLAAIRGFLKFLKDNQIILGNPADTIEGPIREERDPAILLKTEYKALLQVLYFPLNFSAQIASEAGCKPPVTRFVRTCNVSRGAPKSLRNGGQSPNFTCYEQITNHFGVPHLAESRVYCFLQNRLLTT
jgi:integrase